MRKKSELKKQVQEYIKVWNYCSPPLSFTPISNEVINYLINKCNAEKVKDIEEFKKKLAILLGTLIVKQEQWKVTVSWFLQNYSLIETKYGYFDDLDVIRERIVNNLKDVLSDEELRKVLNTVCDETRLEIVISKKEPHEKQVRRRKQRVDKKIFDTVLKAIVEQMNEENKTAVDKILSLPENVELLNKYKDIFNKKLSLFENEQIKARYVLDILYLLNLVYQIKEGDVKNYNEQIKRRMMQMVDDAIRNIDLANLSFYNDVNIFELSKPVENKAKLSISDRFLIRDLF